MNEDILEYNGVFYTLSDTRMPYKSDKTADNEYFILTLFILALEAKNRNVSLDGRDLILGIGVPPADFSQQAGKFKQYFMDEAKEGVTFRWNGAEIHFGIKDVQVSPQNFAAVFCYKASLFKQYRTVNCIDIGDGTVDLLVIRKGQPDLSVRVSERLGIAVLRSEIANTIQQNYGLQLESSDVEQVLLNEPTVLDEEVIHEIQRMADEWMVRIINRLHTYVPDFRINPTVFLGGGSQVLHKQIETSPEFKYIEFIDNIKANAVGYAMLVKAKLKKQ
jgi:plasmid segregation protein ParM